MRSGLLGVTFVAALLATAITADAQVEPAGFKSPSGNIHCQFFEGWADEKPTLRCDIRNIAKPPPRPRDCDLDWGRAFEIAEGAPAGQRICAGDTVADDSLTPLAYGRDWQRGGFLCRSETNGVTYRNSAGHGFFISRASQRLF
jgi:hypothetical protein